MKHLPSILYLVCCFAFQLTAGNSFEGNLTLTSEKNSTATGKTLLAVKNDLVAINPGMGPQAVLNVNTGDFSTVVDQGGQKIVAKMNVSVLSSLPELPAFMGPFSGYMGKEDAASEVKATDEVKTISGYKCKKYLITNEGSTATVWATEGFPFSFAPLMELLKMSGSNNPALKASFPMQAAMKDNKTSETTGFSVAVEKKTLDNALFTFPKDLLEMDMTPLIRQMMETNDPAQIKRVLDSLMPK